MSYDAWKTTDSADATLGRSDGQPTKYVCLDCSWTGAGSIVQARHWHRTKHRIVWHKDPRAQQQLAHRKAG